MKRLFIELLIVVCTILTILFSVNYLIDPSYVYHSEALADSLISYIKTEGNATNITDCDERIYKRKLLVELHRNDTLDYLVLGSSRAFLINSDQFPGKKLFNASVSAAQLEDFESFIQICKENNIHYKNMIISVDPTLFYASDTRWKSNMEYYKRYHNEEICFKDQLRIDKIKNLLSPSYFQSAIKGIILKTDIPSPSPEKKNNGTTYHKDGSLFYGIDYRTKSQVEVDKFATTWEHGSYSENNNFSPTYAKRFESLLKLLNDNGVKVLFVFSPYHPIFWKRIRGLKPMVEGMEYIDSIAKKYEISTIGAYDPILINADNTDFYDGAHPRQEMMDRLVVSGNSLGK